MLIQRYKSSSKREGDIEGLIWKAISHFTSQQVSRTGPFTQINLQHAGLGVSLSVDYLSDIMESKEFKSELK